MRWRGPRVSPARRLTPELGERSVDARNQRGDFSGFDFVIPEMTGDDPRDVMPIGLDVVSHAFISGRELRLEDRYIGRELPVTGCFRAPWR
jgi:hypothetical protein